MAERTLTEIEQRAYLIRDNALALAANVERHEEIRLADPLEFGRAWHARPGEYHGNASKEPLQMQIRILRNELLALSKALDEKEEL